MAMMTVIAKVVMMTNSAGCDGDVDRDGDGGDGAV
jgi:hypothetical protein